MPVVLTLAGQPDYDQIAILARQVCNATQVIVDMTRATGSSSTHIAACIQVAAATGRPVIVRGCRPNFAVSVLQMRLGHLVRVE